MQDKVPPSRTPRPAHPALLVADRLVDILQRYPHRINDVDDLEAFQTVRRVLWRIATEDDK